MKTRRKETKVKLCHLISQRVIPRTDRQLRIRHVCHKKTQIQQAAAAAVCASVSGSVCVCVCVLNI